MILRLRTEVKVVLPYLTKPKVSVLMAVYNGLPFLPEAIDSILRQSFTDFEFLIIDDASTDETPLYLEKYAVQDQRIRLRRNQTRKGLTRSLNTGLNLVQGEYIARQDADDISLPGRLAAQVAFLEKQPQVGVLGTWVKNIDETGRQVGVWRTPVAPALVNWSLHFGPVLVHPAVLMRRSLFMDGTTYQPDLTYAQDYELWLRLSVRTKLANLPQPLYLRRRHQRQIGNEHYSDQELITKMVIHKALARLLGEEIPVQLLTGLRFGTRGHYLTDSKELRAVADLIERIYCHYIAQNKLATVELSQVANDAARRLELLALYHLRCCPVEAAHILRQAFDLEPSVPVITRLRKLGTSFYKASFR